MSKPAHTSRATKMLGNHQLSSCTEFLFIQGRNIMFYVHDGEPMACIPEVACGAMLTGMSGVAHSSSMFLVHMHM